jgi:hypothetical protein
MAQQIARAAMGLLHRQVGKLRACRYELVTDRGPDELGLGAREALGCICDCSVQRLWRFDLQRKKIRVSHW